uniref:Arabinogalactan peptide 23-like n=1 Tax=Nicotiana tabacum TaxID=4097 RepID=A0A1S3ZN07_TOBAC|nr:PREDICTED: arabinogalactan peptide 23-like [Nicotiana tabacum]
MKKITCAALVAAASMSAAMAQMSPSDAPAPSPTSDAAVALPAVGTLIGATLLSFFAYYMY